MLICLVECLLIHSLSYHETGARYLHRSYYSYSLLSRWKIHCLWYFSESKSLSIGSGASLLIYDSQTFGFLRSIRVLKKALVHGIRFCKLVILIYEN